MHEIIKLKTTEDTRLRFTTPEQAEKHREKEQPEKINREERGKKNYTLHTLRSTHYA